MNSGSASLSTTFSFYNSPKLSLSSATATKHLPLLRHNSINLKPISSTALSCINLCRRNDDFRTVDHYRHSKNRKCSSFKPCVSAQPENQPHQTNNEDGSDSAEFEGLPTRMYPSSLKSLIQVYKEAVLNEDAKTICEVESLILSMEKEKNQLAEKVEALSSEISSGKEKYIRLQADFDNYRKRSEKERLTVRSDAQGEVIESLLPMVDNFERAKQQIKLETEREKKIDTSYQGIYKQFVEIMRSLQVSAVPTVGKPFDPLIHEAIAREESEEFKEGIVTQEFRRGFYLGERLLRPAMVKVSSGPGGKKNKQPQQPASSVAGIDNR